jgi:hypothetical protein
LFEKYGVASCAQAARPNTVKVAPKRKEADVDILPPGYSRTAGFVGVLTA